MDDPTDIARQLEEARLQADAERNAAGARALDEDAARAAFENQPDFLTRFDGSAAVSPQTGVTDPAKAKRTSVLVSPICGMATGWEVDLVSDKIPANGTLYYWIRYSLGETVFEKGPFVLGSTSPERFWGNARSVQVDVAWINSADAVTVTFKCAAAPGVFPASPLDWYGQQKLTNTGAGAGAVLCTGKGVVLDAQINCASMPAAPGATACWVMFFDGVAAPAPGDKPLAPVATGFSGAPQGFPYDGGPSPSMRFQNGLVWALSSAVDVYAACGAGAIVRVDVTRGQ